MRNPSSRDAAADLESAPAGEVTTLDSVKRFFADFRGLKAHVDRIDLRRNQVARQSMSVMSLSGGANCRRRSRRRWRSLSERTTDAVDVCRIDRGVAGAEHGAANGRRKKSTRLCVLQGKRSPRRDRRNDEAHLARRASLSRARAKGRIGDDVSRAVATIVSGVVALAAAAAGLRTQRESQGLGLGSPGSPSSPRPLPSASSS